MHFFGTRPLVDGVYFLTEAGSFLSDYYRVRPFLFKFVFGYEEFDEGEINARCRSGEWSVRIGTHFLTYANTLEAKLSAVDELIQPPKFVDMNSIFGVIANPLATVMTDTQVAITRTTVHSYFTMIKKTKEPGDPSIDEITKILLAVTEVEGNDVISIMEQYTDVEIMERWNAIREGGMRLRYLPYFEEREKLFCRVGIDSLRYYWSINWRQLRKFYENSEKIEDNDRTLPIEDKMDTLDGLVEAEKRER